MMKDMPSLQSELNRIRNAKAIAIKALEELNAKIAKLDDGTRTKDFIYSETKKLQDQYSQITGKSLTEVNEILAGIAPSRKFWSNKPFLLSAKPAGRENTLAERAAIIAEANVMPEDVLKLRYELAVTQGKHGDAFLLGSTYNARKPDNSADKIDLAAIQLLEHDAAMTIFKDAQVEASRTELIFRESIGSTVTPRDRIAAERGGGHVGLAETVEV